MDGSHPDWCVMVDLYHILNSIYKWYHMVFVFLIYFTWYDNLYLHPCCCKWHCLVLFYGWEVFHCICVPHLLWGFPGGASDKESTCQCRRCKRWGFDCWVGKIPWNWQPAPVFLPRKFHGQRSLVGYSPWGCKLSDMTEWLNTHTTHTHTHTHNFLYLVICWWTFRLVPRFGCCK